MSAPAPGWTRRAPLLWALVRYALVGVVNAATYYVVYLLVLREVGYLTAHVIGLGAAMIVSFFLNCRVTFRVRPSWRRFLLYPASQAVNVAATTVGVVALVGVGVDERLAPLVAAVLAVPVSFLATRLVLAHHRATTTTGPIPVVTATGPVPTASPTADTGPIPVVPDDPGTRSPGTGPLATVDPAAAAVLEEDPATLQLIAVRR
ncbi:GtrA family protein [Actinomycetospora endophytica]|uniref:GtrA family protein n=1 Tax=Actinomycetospora endophytica TaxID=2291215 RepID=A0ABS8P4W7_9PSEU|nr:GtrA family protein [Actinomycetospora endophytica]MCD2193298.1 GtrA family protein [Actinomycetospora endophytica]